jgi:heme-degrading monooxygenase HmoA
MIMFARVSTYRPGPDSSGAPSDETVKRVLGLPGCLGIYYLLGKDNKSLSITLWGDEEALAGSQQQADKIRAETSAEQHMQILGVEEFEVLTRQLND